MFTLTLCEGCSQELSCIEVCTTKVRRRFWVLFDAPRVSRASPDPPPLLSLHPPSFLKNPRLTLMYMYDNLHRNPLILFFLSFCFVPQDLIEK